MGDCCSCSKRAHVLVGNLHARIMNYIFVYIFCPTALPLGFLVYVRYNISYIYVLSF